MTMSIQMQGPLNPVKPIYSSASLNDCPALRRIRFTMIFLLSQLRSQNNGLNGGISLSDDRFPASETNFRFTIIKNSWSSGFQNGHQVLKMAPRCVLGRIPRYTGTENDRPYGGSSLDSESSAHWKALNMFSMHFSGFFKFLLNEDFAVQQFRWDGLSLLSKAPL